MSTRDQIIEIVGKHTTVDTAEITEESTLDDLNIESLDLVEIIFEIEEAFDIEVPYNANEGGSPGIDLNSIGDVVAAVQKIVEEKDAAE